MDFVTLPSSGRFRLDNMITPNCLAGQEGPGFAPTTLTLEDGRAVEGPAEQVIDMQGKIILPCGVDMHTHLDKGHIWHRAPNPDGTFAGALATVGADRAANWTAEDVRRRMDFSLRCAFAHGTRAIRTHLDSIAPQDAISWPVFAETRAEWAGRIDLQAVCLVGIDLVENGGDFAVTADLVKQYGGHLGCVAYPVPDIDARLDTFFAMAAERGLDTDLHVDETLDPDSTCLLSIAQSVLRTGFQGKVVAGHCCSMSTQSDALVEETLLKVAEAGIAIVSLPMCNLYLQDRHANRTPRKRGITLVHEIVARGIPLAFASDNTRDPFYAYGDMDMIEVLRQAVRIGHLDHSHGLWPLTINNTPAQICNFPEAEAGDFILLNARDWTEAFSRPQSDRVVVRGGVAIDRRLPDYAELDDLMERS